MAISEPQNDWLARTWGEHPQAEELRRLPWVGVPSVLVRNIRRIGVTPEELHYTLLYAGLHAQPLAQRLHANPKAGGIPTLPELGAECGQSERTLRKHHQSLVLKALALPTRHRYAVDLCFSPMLSAALAVAKGHPPYPGEPVMCRTEGEATEYRAWLASIPGIPRVPQVGQSNPAQGTPGGAVSPIQGTPCGYSRVPQVGQSDVPVWGTLKHDTVLLDKEARESTEAGQASVISRLDARLSRVPAWRDLGAEKQQVGLTCGAELAPTLGEAQVAAGLAELAAKGKVVTPLSVSQFCRHARATDAPPEPDTLESDTAARLRQMYGGNR